MAKSKALLQAEETMAKLREREKESDAVIIQLTDQQCELQRQLDASATKALVRRDDYAGLCKRFDDLKIRSHKFAKAYMDLLHAFAGVVVRNSRDRAGAEGPFACAGLINFDAEDVFRHFADKASGADHWQLGKTKESATFGSITF